MSILTSTRRGFLKGACILSGGLLLGVRMVNKAYAGAREIKDYMRDRVNAVYGADKTFPKRASQDNAQVKALYDSWLGKPLGHKSEDLKKLTASGAYPNPRHKDFAGNAYPYE